MVSDSNKEARFRACVARHHGVVFRLCKFREFDVEARKDLEQEIWLALWRAFDQFRGDASERTYVLRVAHNIAATHALTSARRRRKNDEFAGESNDVPRSGDVVEARSSLRRIEEELRRLDVTTQQVMLLHLEGLTTSEIAEVTGLTPTNVTTKIARVRKQMQERFEGAAS